MIKILFICWGNICRSPMAEFMLKYKVEKKGIADRFFIASAATSTEEIWNGKGNPVYPPARQKLLEHGISCKGKYAVCLTKDDYYKYDYLICMDSTNLRYTERICGPDKDDKVYRLLDFTDDRRDVADPWYTGDFDKTYDDIEKGLEGLLLFLENAIGNEGRNNN